MLRQSHYYANGHRTESDRIVLRDEGTEHQTDTRVEVLDGLRGGRVGRRGREIGDPLADKHLGPLAVQRHQAGTGENHGVGHLIERPDEDRGIARDEPELHVGGTGGGVAGGDVVGRW